MLSLEIRLRNLKYKLCDFIYKLSHVFPSPLTLCTHIPSGPEMLSINPQEWAPTIVMEVLKKKKATAAFLLNTARCVLLCAFVADSFVAVKEKSADVPVPVCQFYYILYGSLQMATTLPAIHITVTTVATVIFAGQYDTAWSLCLYWQFHFDLPQDSALPLINHRLNCQPCI